jgi:hypothetical protein
MATWKKVVVSGSAISQLNNDSNYITTGASLGGDLSGTIADAQINENVVGATELDVTGNGTSGQFLQSDGDGSFSWAAQTQANDATITLSPGAGIGAIGSFTTNQGTPDSLTIGVDGVLEDLDTLGAPTEDGQMIVATGEGSFAYESGSTLRSSIGVDPAGTDNSTNVTLNTTSYDYLSISGQEITLGQIDISDDTNLAVSDTTGQTGIDLTLTEDTISGVVSGLTTTSDVTFNDLTVSGDLTVVGTASFQHTENLEVADRFIRLASGSNAAGDGGIVIQQGSDGLGEAFGFEDSVDRWVVADAFDASTGTITADAFVAAVSTGNFSSDSTIQAGIDSRYSAIGNIFVGDDEGIWIYS